MFTCESGRWKIVNVTLQSKCCWLYRTGIKTSNKTGGVLYFEMLVLEMTGHVNSFLKL